MDGVAVGVDRSQDRATPGVLDHVRLGGCLGAPLQRDLEGGFGVRNQDRHVVHPGPMPMNVLRHRMVGAHRPGDDEADLALLEQIGGGLPGPGLGTAVAGDLETEQVAEELGGLEGVAHPPLQVGEALDGEGVARCHVLGTVQGGLIDGHEGAPGRSKGEGYPQWRLRAPSPNSLLSAHSCRPRARIRWWLYPQRS